VKRFSDLGHLLDSLAEGVFLFDENGIILFWNAAAVSILGFEREEMVGRSVFTVFRGWNYPWEREESSPGYPLSALGEILAVQSQSGGERMLSLRAAPRFSRSGSFTGGIGTFRDVSVKLEEMALSQRIQADLINRQPRCERLSLDLHFRPHGVIGGDYFKLFRLAGSYCGFFFGDFTGHGVVGAMYTVMMDKYLAEKHELFADLPQLADQLNRDFCELLAPGYFCTAVLAVLESDTGAVNYIHAASPPFVVLSLEGTERRYESSSPPLGMFREAQFTVEQLQLEHGQTLVLFSDGLMEAPGPNDSRIQLRGVLDALRSLQGKGQEWHACDLYEELARAHPWHRFEDDVLVVKLELL